VLGFTVAAVAVASFRQASRAASSRNPRFRAASRDFSCETVGWLGFVLHRGFTPPESIRIPMISATDRPRTGAFARLYPYRGVARFVAAARTANRSSADSERLAGKNF
jgi:hypothetical protein